MKGFRDESRYYEVGGKKYPSVTTVLNIIAKPALAPWMAKLEREFYEGELRKLSKQSLPHTGILKLLKREKGKKGDEVGAESMAIGSEVHASVEWVLRKSMGKKVGKLPKFTHEQAAVAFESWLAWWKSSKLKPLAMEQMVFSKKYGYAGTLDLYARGPKRRVVVDWKTSKAIYWEYFLQARAYQHAAAELKMPAEMAVIVRLPKDGKDVEVEAAPDVITIDHFLSALSLWKLNRVLRESRKK